MSGYLLVVTPNGSIPKVKAGDIMLVRLPAPNIMVISRERKREEESDKQKRQASW